MQKQREYGFSLKLSEDEHAAVHQLAERNGIPKASWVRMALRGVLRVEMERAGLPSPLRDAA